MWEMRDGYCGRRAAVFVQEEDVAERSCFGGGEEVGENEITAVETDGRGQEEADLLAVSCQACGWRARGRHQWSRVCEAAEHGVLIVEGALCFGCLVVLLRFIVLEVLAQRLVVGDGGVQRFASGEAALEESALLGDAGVAELQSPAVEVVATLAGLSAQHGGGVGQCQRRGECSRCSSSPILRLFFGFFFGYAASPARRKPEFS